MAKALDAPYEAGNRGASWLKIKRVHTLDLVVLGAEWGYGRRTGKLSNLHLGALDPATGEYIMLGKTFKGLTDAMLDLANAGISRARNSPRYRHRVHPTGVGGGNRLQRSAGQQPLSRRASRCGWRGSSAIETTSRSKTPIRMETVRKIYAAQSASSGAAG